MDLHNHYTAGLIYISVCTHRQSERVKRGNFLRCASGEFPRDLPALVSWYLYGIKHKKDMYKRQEKISKQKENKVAKC